MPSMLLLLGLMSGLVEGQLQLASVTAHVVDAGGRPIANAAVLLTDPLGAEVRRAQTDGGGRVVFDAIAPGRYQLRTAAPGAAPFELPLTVRASLAMELTVRVPAAVIDEVEVVGGQVPEPSSRGSIAGESLTRVPVRVRGRALQEVVGTLPGWSSEDNGLIHARGIDDGFLYVIDGVPVYERLDAVSGLSPDLSGVSAVTVISGYVPPEYGYKAGGVIEVRSSSADVPWTAAADLRVASQAAVDGSASAGGRLRPALALRGGVALSRSDRFLDPVHPDNLHNSGGQNSGSGELEWIASSLDRLTVGAGYGGSRFDVPNTAEQQEVGQDQRQRLRQGFFNATWQRTWSGPTVTHATFYRRDTNASLDGSARDTPLEAHAERSLGRSGVIVAATRQHDEHLVKAGLEWQQLSLDERFQFSITDADEAEAAGFREEALMFDRTRPFRFAGTRTPTLWSAYVQDSWQAAAGVTISGGVRFDRSELLVTRTAWSPRLGVAWGATTHTVVRGAVSRFFQPPQPEYLLLSSSPEARVLSAVSVGTHEGGADVEPERQWATELGIEQRIGRRLRLDAAYWERRLADVADPNVFAGTTIIFPNAVAKGEARGLELRLEVPRQRGWSGFLNWSTARVRQTGPVTGGLFLEDEIEELGEGVEFVPDHDQRIAAAGGVTWTHPSSGAAVSIVTRYETGTPVQQEEDDLDELLDRPGAETVDFASGRVKPRTIVSLMVSAPTIQTGRARLKLGLQALNLFDADYAYNFGNPFSGTHFGAPRTLAVTLGLTVR